MSDLKIKVYLKLKTIDFRHCKPPMEVNSARSSILLKSNIISREINPIFSFTILLTIGKLTIPQYLK